MSNLKKFILILIVGGIGGVLLNNLFLPVLIKADFLNSASFLSKLIKPQMTINKITKETIVVSQADVFEKALNNNQSSIVAIQSFQGGKLLRYGSGLIVSSDGLIVTTNNVVSSDASAYQIFLNEKITRGRVVKRDFVNNLALLKVDDTGLRSISLEEESKPVGSIVLIGGKLIGVERSINLFAQSALISFIFKERIQLDTKDKDYLSGAAAIDDQGRILGIIYRENTNVWLARSQSIKKFLDNYMEGLSR